MAHHAQETAAGKANMTRARDTLVPGDVVKLPSGEIYIVFTKGDVVQAKRLFAPNEKTCVCSRCQPASITVGHIEGYEP